MRSDVTRWREKYQHADPDPQLSIDSLLSRHVDLLSGKGLALDLAAGSCHAGVYLATVGNRVIALDCSVTALRIGQRLATRMDAHIDALAADLDSWLFPELTFSVVTCFRYLNRSLFGAMQKALKPGGLLIYKTFNTHHLQKARNFNPAYVLQPGELTDTFPQIEVVDCNDGHDSEHFQSWIVGQLPGQSM